MSTMLLQGMCYDDKSSYQKGPKDAPAMIRKALYSGSMNLTAENRYVLDNQEVVDKGDFQIDSYFDMERITKEHLNEAKKIFTFGGDHSISFPVVKALSGYYPKLDILHFDAHPDLYHDYEGDPYAHACPFARIMESGLANRLVQVGIRTMNAHQAEQANKFNLEVHEMKGIDLSKIKKFENPLYISLDMDVFDPAYAPGVSHHEPGGLTSRQVIETIQNLDANIVGADIVEYNPNRDFQGMTAFLAAKLFKEIVSKMVLIQ